MAMSFGLYVSLFVCRFQNLRSHSLRGSTWRRAGAYRIVYRSKQYLTYRNSTLGRSPSPVRWPGMHCLMTSETHRSVPTISEEAKDASVSECTWTLSALEALLNALYKFKTYVLTYYEVGSPTGSFEPGLHSSLAGRHRRQRNLSSKSCQTKVRCTPSCRE